MVSNRVSYVDTIKINDVVSSSTMHIGDSKIINTKVDVLAVQKQYPLFYGEEGDLSKFSIYRERIPLPVVNENVRVNIENEVPIIKVGAVDIIAIAAASVFQVGNTGQVHTEARLKHFRRFFYAPPGYAPRTDMPPIL